MISLACFRLTATAMMEIELISLAYLWLTEEPKS
jgi:hypothetical protein